MPQRTVTFRSVLGGISPTQYLSSEGQYSSGIGIDPDFPLSDSDTRTSGVLVPTVYEKFSGSNVTARVINIITNPKNALIYVVLSNGRLISYDSSLGNETLIGTVSGGAANGTWYYNNYIYIATGTNVSRYGPLNNSPALTDSVWTGATLGSQTALTNTTYPSIRNLAIPNHWGTIHGDGASYFLDFKNGQGMVHKLKTTKTTDEGDTNNGSTYNALDLPFGFYPTAISSISTDLVISTIQTTDSTVNQGRAALFFWDPTNTDTFFRGPVYVADPLITALLYANGLLYIFSGNTQAGMRISQYQGGDTVSEIYYNEDGLPPFAGGVDALGNRIVWGTTTSYSETTASVFAIGSKNSKLPRSAVHNIVRTTSTGANPMATCVRYVQQSSNTIPKVIVSWGDDSGYGIDKRSTTATFASVFRSEVVNVGRSFEFERIRIPVGASITTNMTLTVKVFTDDASTSTTLATINSTNYGGKRKVIYKKPQLSSIRGSNNFFLELRWTGTVTLPVLMPISVDINVLDDEHP